jgi:hypothetical protein
MTENLSDYGQIVETVHLKDGTIRKIGFQCGKWIVQNRDEKVAISIDGYLLYFEYSPSGRAHSYVLFNGFEDMTAKENNGIDFMVLGAVAAALGEDYV